MLYWAVAFFVIAIIATVFRFSGSSRDTLQAESTA